MNVIPKFIQLWGLNDERITMPRKRRTKTLDVFEMMKAQMNPESAYRVDKLCEFTGYKKPALRRYLRRLVNAGLLTVYKHPDYLKRKFYALSVKGKNFQRPKEEKKKIVNNTTKADMATAASIDRTNQPATSTDDARSISIAPNNNLGRTGYANGQSSYRNIGS